MSSSNNSYKLHNTIIMHSLFTTGMNFEFKWSKNKISSHVYIFFVLNILCFCCCCCENIYISFFFFLFHLFNIQLL